MIDCADKIWEAGENKIGNVDENITMPVPSNPYPFELRDKQDPVSVNLVKNSLWNRNIAQGKTIIASTSEGSSSLRTVDYKISSVNIATGSTVVEATSISGDTGTQNNCCDPGNAVDFVPDTYWASKWKINTDGPQWLTIDLNQTYDLGEVMVNWRRRARRYWIQISEDGSTWTNIRVPIWGDPNQEKPTNVVGNSGRFVRIYCRGFYEGLDKDRIEIYEVEVYPLVVSQNSTDDLSFDPYNAVDGKNDTYWKNDANSTLSSEWLVIDLGRSFQLGRIDIDWQLQPKDYMILIGDDNVNWNYTLAGTGLSGQPESTNTTDTFIENENFAQYLRIEMTTVLGESVAIRGIAVYPAAAESSAGTSKW